MATYVDSSAIVKLVWQEPESDTLRRHLGRRRPLLSSTLARTEVLRAVHAGGEAAMATGRRVLAGLELMRINDRVLNLAVTILPAQMRTLDAIHLATAEQVRDELSELVTYDTRMAEAARRLGHRVIAPA